MQCSPVTLVHIQAMLDAKKAIDLDGKMVKAHHALACAQLTLRRFKAAAMSARAGERLLNLKADRTTDFTLLLDQIAAAGAMQGDYAAFDGRILEVSTHCVDSISLHSTVKLTTSSVSTLPCFAHISCHVKFKPVPLCCLTATYRSPHNQSCTACMHQELQSMLAAVLRACQAALHLSPSVCADHPCHFLASLLPCNQVCPESDSSQALLSCMYVISQCIIVHLGWLACWLGAGA